MKLETKQNTQVAIVDIDGQDRITVGNNTFDIKDDLKNMGMKWDGLARVWYYKPGSDEDCIAFLKKLNDYAPGFGCFDADMVEFVNNL